MYFFLLLRLFQAFYLCSPDRRMPSRISLSFPVCLKMHLARNSILGSSVQSLPHFFPSRSFPFPLTAFRHKYSHHPAVFPALTGLFQPHPVFLKADHFQGLPTYHEETLLSHLLQYPLLSSEAYLLYPVLHSSAS